MYIIVYDDNGTQIKVPVSLGKEGELLRMVNGVPTWTPQDYVPPMPSLEVDAGSNQTISYGSTVTLAARSELTKSYKWELVPQDNSGSAVGVPAPADGNLVIDGSKYAPGSVLVLAGNYKSVTINNLIGTPEKPILVTNNPFSKVTIGNPSWAGSGYAYGLKTSNSRYFKIVGTEQGAITITGSTVTTLSPGNEPWKSAYRNLSFDNFSEFFEIINVTTTNGGTSIVAKTDPTTNSKSWYPIYELGDMVFRNVIVSSPHNEGFYIGHTATYWNIKTNTPLYPGPNDPSPDVNTYKQPILIRKVIIEHSKVTDSGLDGIQIAATKYVEVLNSEVFNWAKQKNSAHNGGILIGGRVESSLVQNNNVHDGWGEAYQFYGVGVLGKSHAVINNYFNNNQGDMMSLRGSNGAIVYIKNNNITDAGPTGNLVRVNGYYNKLAGKDVVQAVVSDNILAGPHNNMATGGTVYDKYYIYSENPFVGIVTENNNFKVPKVSDLTTNRPPEGVGAIPSVTGPTDINPIIEAPDKSITQVSNLLKGVYTFKVTGTDGDKTASDTVTVTVI
jgi:hypothetical protein